jgi:ribonuclease BN (tRNA processing enzyme)
MARNEEQAPAGGGWLKFLGTAGARFVVAKQLRASGGLWLCAGGANVMIDPGPGSLVRCAASRPKLDASKLDAVVLTHAHIDHCCDVNVLLDAMTEGGLKRRGVLIAPRQCLDGPDAVVLRYVRQFVQHEEVLAAGSEHRIGQVSIRGSIRHEHAVETYGLIIQAEGVRVGLVVDTAYFDGLAKGYAGCELLIVNTVLHQRREERHIQHLCLEDAARLIEQIQPGRAVLTHFGMTMLRAKPWELAAELSKQLGREVLAARDGMTVEMAPAKTRPG